MNQFLINLEKIEFAVTYACTGKCKHCSEGSHNTYGEHIDPIFAADSVKRIASDYNIKTVMTFGGEPLLYSDTVYTIMKAALDMNIPKRQVITNGYFSNDINVIREVSRKLSECGVNDLLLSTDAFHQETIPLDIVRCFAVELQKYGVPVRLQPAWLVNSTDDNIYNIKTREILDSFADLQITAGNGNIVFPEGNALKYLTEFFNSEKPANPYVENPFDIRCLSFSPNGDVLCGNIYNQDIIDIISSYRP